MRYAVLLYGNTYQLISTTDGLSVRLIAKYHSLAEVEAAVKGRLKQLSDNYWEVDWSIKK